MKRRHISKKRIIITSVLSLIIVSTILVAVSYYALVSLTFAGDRVLYGRKMSDVAAEIRATLLKRPDTTAVTIESSDNIKLSGIFIQRSCPIGNVLLCHGYRGSKEFMYSFVDEFSDWNILLFDFRAHGQSSGKITSIGYHEHNDVIAASSFLRNQTAKGLPFVIFGISMGAAASIKAAEEKPDLCDAIISDSSYAHLGATVFKSFSSKASLPRYPFYPILTFLFQMFAKCDIHDMNPAASLKNISIPVFIIHSRNDSYIPATNALKLYANTNNKLSKLWIGPSCRHGWLYSYHPDIYRKKIRSFIKKSLTTYSV